MRKGRDPYSKVPGPLTPVGYLLLSSTYALTSHQDRGLKGETPAEGQHAVVELLALLIVHEFVPKTLLELRQTLFLGRWGRGGNFGRGGVRILVVSTAFLLW
jgi:hypothetical protein